MMEDLFLQLSEILTGFKNLDAKIASVYYKQLDPIYKPELQNLLNVFDLKVQGQPGDPEQLICQYIWYEAEFKPICQAIILTWYNAQIVNGPDTWMAPQQIYYEALLWKAVEAHPPALSGGYFGYWRYAPEN